MGKHRVEKLNSLLREVISDVIRKRVRNPDIDEMFTVTDVRISRDLQHAKVLVSVMGDDKKKKNTIQALNSAAGFIAVQSSKEVRIRIFPELFFILDDSVDKHSRIEELIHEIQEERTTRDEETHDSAE